MELFSKQRVRKNLKPIFLSPHKKVLFKGLKINPFPVPHDARESIALTVESNSFKIGILTDVGIITKTIRDELEDVDALILEFNYDDDLLSRSKYPEGLKENFIRYGHLSNSSAMGFAKDFFRRERKVLVAAHLSSSNNSHNYVTALLDNYVTKRKLNHSLQIKIMVPPWINLS